jgi:hypothetical protein
MKMKMSHLKKDHESMWWPNKRQVGWIASLLIVTSVSVASAQSLASREAELATRESRLSLWEDDLARRAEGDAYFDNLTAYVTPREMARVAFLTLLISVATSVLTVRFLQSRSLFGGASARQQELERTEKRVLTGLGELEGLLDRFYRALETEPAAKPTKMRVARTRSTKRRPAPVDTESVSMAASAVTVAESFATEAVAAEAAGAGDGARSNPGGNEGGDGGWREVVRLSRTGLDAETIGERLRLHPSEVEFILKVDARR